MKNQTDEILLSQLVDGELESDQLNDVLLDVLDDADRRRQLAEHLRLRQSLGQWRRQKPAGPVIAVSDHRKRHHFPWRIGSLAVAAMLGGALVLAGIWTAGGLGRNGKTNGSPVIEVVTAEQMRQVASVFALHESVAGPLKWYAADDEKIQLASAGGSEVGRKPVAVLLRLAPAGADSAQARTYIVVCRNGESATIEFPQAGGASTVRLHLLPGVRDGKVNIQYAITVDGSELAPKTSAALSGQRLVGLDHTPLGQLALADELVNVDASAWVIRKGLK